MDGWLALEVLENTPLRQWFVYAGMLITIVCALLRTAVNVREIRRLGQRPSEYYAVRKWGASSGPLRIFLTAECFVVDGLCVLILLVLSDVTL